MKKNFVRSAWILMIAALLLAALGAALPTRSASADEACAPDQSCGNTTAPQSNPPVPSAASAVWSYDQGWYDESGFHSPANGNYVTGDCCGAGEHRSFYAFDLSSLSGWATGAVLYIYNPEYYSSDATENLALFDVSTNLGDLLGGTGGTSAHYDLGSGASYGGATVSDANDNAWVAIPLNANGIAAINSVIGWGDFTVGAALTSLSGNPDEYVFGFSDGSVELVIYTSNNGNLLINPGYDNFVTAPKAWLYSVVNTPLSSLRDCNYYISPGCSLKLAASKTTSVVTQTVNFMGYGGEAFIYGLSSAAYNVPPGGSYKVEVSLFNRFNRVMYTQTQYFTDGTHDFQTVLGYFEAPLTAFNKMRFRIYFQKGAGAAWFDDAFLIQQ